MDPNRISATLSTDDQQAVLNAIEGIRQKLPFLIDLSADDRNGMAKLGDKTRGFVRKGVDIANEHSSMFATGFLAEMRKDSQLFETLAPILLAVDRLRKQVEDTSVQVGAEAYAAARTVYTVTKTPFASAALRTAAQDLGRRFGRKAKAPASESPVPPADASPSSTTILPSA
jgi:hypothetical protein